MQKDRTYVCIDLKSFYASVECRERGLDPMTTNLVVADPERSCGFPGNEKTGRSRSMSGF